jgi:hypothetical protein
MIAMKDKTTIEMLIKIHIRSHPIKITIIRDHSKIKISTQNGSQIEAGTEGVVEVIEVATETTTSANRLIEILNTQPKTHLKSRKKITSNRKANRMISKMVISLMISSIEVVVAAIEEVVEEEVLKINVEELITRRI